MHQLIPLHSYILGDSAKSTKEQLLLKIRRNDADGTYSIKTVETYQGLNDMESVPNNAIYDSKRNMVWMMGTQLNGLVLYYINATNGEMVNVITCATTNQTCPGSNIWANGGIYDAKLDKIITLNWVMVKNESNVYYKLVHLDPVTLNIMKEFDSFDGWLGGSLLTIDTNARICYGLLMQRIGNFSNGQIFVNLVQFNISDGNIIYYTSIGNESSQPMNLLYWNK